LEGDLRACDSQYRESSELHSANLEEENALLWRRIPS
jgi:hypothetical protein